MHTINTAHLLVATLLGLSLAMDCLAIAISQGLRGLSSRALLKLSLLFGLFQGAMLFLGHLAGLLLAQFFSHYMSWLAAGLLFWIGLKMLKTGLSDETESTEVLSRWRDFVLLAIATSLDALAAGLSLQSLQSPFWLAVSLTTLISFGLSWLGGRFGTQLGSWIGHRAEALGGLILIGLGAKTLF